MVIFLVWYTNEDCRNTYICKEYINKQYVIRYSSTVLWVVVIMEQVLIYILIDIAIILNTETGLMLICSKY